MVNFNKLVRDKIPTLITKDGGSYTMQLLSPEEHIRELKNKLLEEVQDFTKAVSDDKGLEELIDIAELIRTFLQLKNITPEQFEQLRSEKKLLKGGFERGIYLMEISK